VPASYYMYHFYLYDPLVLPSHNANLSELQYIDHAFAKRSYVGHVSWPISVPSTLGEETSVQRCHSFHKAYHIAERVYGTSNFAISALVSLPEAYQREDALSRVVTECTRFTY